jgi:hypothetical protein
MYYEQHKKTLYFWTGAGDFAEIGVSADLIQQPSGRLK